jgi:hypothetical protein
MIPRRPNTSMKTGTAPAATQDFRIAEDVLEGVFQEYLSAPRGDRDIHGDHDTARERDWAKRQGQVCELLLLSKQTRVRPLLAHAAAFYTVSSRLNPL